ncbi:type II toxin-antitoxin system Phd/YefM family antitoxin [Salmonella enterica]|uniref:Antitoxin n=1 Tax=Salmonella enterica TaxID=28901 RepID=A0A624WFW8_SALER|nr:type II toxin-antitoxin system Phd/YefM family antitoxin [Salmonella enterica]EBQ7940039.1 type II toxin-antitoxin system Phd/YefM family antitoxin [Salmonella enterica]ECL8623157.1 type II toxin-antitoxin system Phd/YefM family antitoxin [Salmonella enterica]ECP5714629.1 type II toxin-antitoxin system Phd/YefM family antitoxin [Salmonella enterica]ECZ7313744.1 type II toxin-antitoxin system Phd/YefM family antitoxin [Salmonella enterica]
MLTTFFTSREFNQEIGKAKKAACQGVVFITDRGKATHVLLSIDEYEQISGLNDENIADALSVPGLSEIEFDTSRLSIFPPDREVF